MTIKEILFQLKKYGTLDVWEDDRFPNKLFLYDAENWQGEATITLNKDTVVKIERGIKLNEPT